MGSRLERTASRLFSSSFFRPLLEGQRAPAGHAETMSYLRQELTPNPEALNVDVVSDAFAFIRSRYRSEYYYRNLLASNLLVGRYRASTAALLHELRVGSSVADCVLVNGHAEVFEIKTEFDSPDKLASQLQNYFRAFSKVTVVTHSALADRYEVLLRNTDVGLVVVGSRSRLTQVRPAQTATQALDVETMYNMFRLSEVRAALASWRNEPAPDFPSGIRYERYLEMVRDVDPMDVQRELHRCLKQRGTATDPTLLRDPRSMPLRALITQLQPTRVQEAALVAWLGSRVA